jgi:hypothetical protein
MKQIEPKSRMWGRCVLATLVAVFFLAVMLPNTGRVVRDPTTTPPTFHIVGIVSGSLLVIALAAVPLALVFIGVFRRSQIEIAGWILVIVLIVMLFMK